MCEIQTEENNSNSLVSQILLTKNLHNTLNNNIAVIRKKKYKKKQPQYNLKIKASAAYKLIQ